MNRNENESAPMQFPLTTVIWPCSRGLARGRICELYRSQRVKAHISPEGGMHVVAEKRSISCWMALPQLSVCVNYVWICLCLQMGRYRLHKVSDRRLPLKRRLWRTGRWDYGIRNVWWAFGTVCEIHFRICWKIGQ